MNQTPDNELKAGNCIIAAASAVVNDVLIGRSADFRKFVQPKWPKRGKMRRCCNYITDIGVNPSG